MSSGPGIPPGFDPEDVRRLAEEMQRMPVQRVLQETMQLLGTLGDARLSGPHRDLEQARLAIDALRALSPVLAPTLDEAIVRAVNGSISNLQLAYVKALAEQPASAAPAPADAPADAAPEA